VKNEMTDLLQLIEEARDELAEIKKAISDETSDYGLDVETAIRFAETALQTQQWSDIARALEKAHYALDREYGEEDEHYDNLIERIRAALGLDPENA
jgi:hypothetical protein